MARRGHLIDLHCHILPGVDDGALDLADSVAMGRQADADGVALVCATPHIRHDHDVRIGELPDRVSRLNEALRAAGTRARALPGAEVAETIVRSLDAAELRALSLGGAGRWLLLEPRPGPLSDSLVATVDHLAARGLRCLVAHPERHLAADLVDRLALLVGRGALVQATAAHFEDAAAEGMLALARQGVVHVVASDAHSSHGGRPVRLSGALARLAEVEPVASHLDWVAREAPRAIVAGEDLVAPFAPAPA
jgi:protein-tyrosine phosphatase